MLSLIRKFRKNEKGATAIEYALIAALISVAAITAYGLLGNEIENTMNTVKTKMEGANTQAGATGG